jgi:predicted enzyme related to lactoylglutathione lyase
MDMSGKIVWFDLYAEDVERAANFYTNVLGWTITPMFGNPDMRIIATNDGEQIGMVMKREAPTAADGSSPNTTAYIAVESFKGSFQAASALGGEALVQPEFIPGDDVNGFAFIKDSEGNIIGIVAPMSTAPESSAVAAGQA